MLIGLVQIDTRGTDAEGARQQMVSLLDLDALSLTRHLDLAA